MSRQPTARVFVAVDPPVAVRQELAEWARAAAGSLRGRSLSAAPNGALRLLEAELLHLTLCFLGSRPVGELGALARAVEGCAEGPCELSLGGPLWLPPRRPRALAVAVRDRDGGLERLRAGVVKALGRVSAWEPERRPFRAHLTVARLGPSPISPMMEDRAGLLLPATPSLVFPAESLCLYRSWLTPSGARYEPLAIAELERPGRDS